MRGLVGAHIQHDEAMAQMIIAGMSDAELVGVAMDLSSLCASMLVHGPWGAGCRTTEDVVAQWRVATAMLVRDLGAK